MSQRYARHVPRLLGLLLNYFKATKEFSSGVVEGLNNKAKVIMRRSYRFHLLHPGTRAVLLTGQIARTSAYP
jgi:hypothetical protein